MNASKFWRGQWWIEWGSTRIDIYGYKHLVASVSRLESRTDYEAVTNARLIAAAPDLYEALHNLCACTPNSDDAEHVAGRAALAKAEGR